VAKARLWDSEWLEFPDGSAVHRSDLRPCPCGRKDFTLWFHPSGLAPILGCSFCVAPKAPRPDDGSKPVKWAPVGTVDMVSGAITMLAKGA
jgi:hypothetical protein